jgi:hypothetical protein
MKKDKDMKFLLAVWVPAFILMMGSILSAPYLIAKGNSPMTACLICVFWVFVMFVALGLTFYRIVVVIPHETDNDSQEKPNIKTPLPLAYEENGILKFVKELDWSRINHFVGIKWKDCVLTRFDEYIPRTMSVEYQTEAYGLSGRAVSEEMMAKIYADSKLQKTFRLLRENGCATRPTICYAFNSQTLMPEWGWIGDEKPERAPEDDDTRIPLRVFYEL